MGDQHQRGPPLLVEVEQQVADALAGAAVQIAGGFVGEQQAGLGGEGAGNGDPLLLAAGQLPWVMTQALAQALAKERHLILIAGRYEGVDERVGELLADERISIGDYVVTGGELPALVVTDAVTRLLPGVLGAEGAAEQESFASGLLEPPQYTQPEEFRGARVPDILLSGDHARVARWRREQALFMTWRRRPELLAEATLTDEERRLIERFERGETPA